jgi:hypothetical protein
LPPFLEVLLEHVPVVFERPGSATKIFRPVGAAVTGYPAVAATPRDIEGYADGVWCARFKARDSTYAFILSASKATAVMEKIPWGVDSDRL